jgi:hypothetical protein
MRLDTLDRDNGGRSVNAYAVRQRRTFGLRLPGPFGAFTAPTHTDRRLSGLLPARTLPVRSLCVF